MAVETNTQETARENMGWKTLEGQNETKAARTAFALGEVAVERHRQEKKWGPQNHSPLEWLAILGEEVGEANRAAIEHHFPKPGVDRDPKMLLPFREELVQVAAVAVAMIESLDRNELAAKVNGEAHVTI